LWERVRYVLEAVLPVAEQACARLAAHPDDPPLPEVRGTPRQAYRPEMYRRLADISKRRSNQFEDFCVGTLAEMQGDFETYASTAAYAAAGRIDYIHLRNVHGKVPEYSETFIDEGDVDVPRIIGTLAENGFQGVVIPGHTPLMDCGPRGTQACHLRWVISRQRCA
jgi:mannonate dehydratase